MLACTISQQLSELDPEGANNLQDGRTDTLISLAFLLLGIIIQRRHKSLPGPVCNEVQCASMQFRASVSAPKSNRCSGANLSNLQDDNSNPQQSLLCYLRFAPQADSKNCQALCKWPCLASRSGKGPQCLLQRAARFQKVTQAASTNLLCQVMGSTCIHALASLVAGYWETYHARIWLQQGLLHVQPVSAMLCFSSCNPARPVARALPCLLDGIIAS